MANPFGWCASARKDSDYALVCYGNVGDYEKINSWRDAEQGIGRWCRTLSEVMASDVGRLNQHRWLWQRQLQDGGVTLDYGDCVADTYKKFDSLEQADDIWLLTGQWNGSEVPMSDTGSSHSLTKQCHWKAVDCVVDRNLRHHLYDRY